MARSDNWRINKSSLMAVEGAQILRALQKVAGAAGLPSPYKVRFATSSIHSGINFTDHEVVIGAGRLFQEAPMPSDKMDVMVGLTLHEVGHYTIGTKQVSDAIGNNTRYTPPIEADLFQSFVNIGEDVVVESRTLANPNLSDYEKSLHNWIVPNLRAAKTNRLLELWIEYALGHKAEAMLDLPPEMNEAMSQLAALTGWLRRLENSKSPMDRVLAYQRYWSTLKDIILNPPMPPKPESEQTTGQDESGKSESQGQSESPPAESAKPDETGEPESPSSSGAEEPAPKEPEQGESAKSSSAPEPGDDSDSKVTGQTSGAEAVEDEMDVPLAPRPEDNIDDDLVKQIEEAVESESEDITDQVLEEFGDQLMPQHPWQQRSIIRSRETKTPTIKPDAQLRKKLERIMTIRKRLQARTMHGEQYGRIDKRHLHRIRTDQRIFSLRYKFPDGFPNTRILIDLSGSMSGKQADEVLEAAGALQTLVNAEVWCYNNTNQINLVRMDEGKLIHRFEPGGNTPSGIAIVGVSLGMKRDGLIIHLTDGRHNHGQPPWNANWIVKGRGIELVNLIWGSDFGSTKQYEFEGMNFRKIDGLAEFPDALYQILVEKARLSKIGGK